MSCTDCQNEGGVKAFDYQYIYNTNCTDCNSVCGGQTIDSKCVGYFGTNLPCSGIVTNDSLELALGKIETAICNASGDYSTYTFNCLDAVTTEAEFVDMITEYVCTTQASLTTFVDTTFPAYDDANTAIIDAIKAPAVTCEYAEVTSADSLNTVLGKYAIAIDSLAAAQDVEAVDWDSCYTVVTPPTTITEAFTQVLSQICATKTIASNAATLPVFNNIGTCLPSPGASDTLVSTIGKIKTRLCQSPTLDNSTLSSSCVAVPSTTTDLQTLLQSILTKLDTISINFPTFSPSDFSVTNVSGSYTCLGKNIALATPINQDRFVASDSSDTSPGTLVAKITAGTNITLDNTTTPGQLIINAPTDTQTTDSNSIDFSGDGSVGTPLTASVKISATAGNTATINSDGIFVSATPAASLNFVETSTTLPSVTGSDVSIDVKIDSSHVGNILNYSTNGLYATAPATTPTVVTGVPSVSINTVATPTAGNNYNITSNAIISGVANNALSVVSDGLAVPLSTTAGNAITINAGGLYAAENNTYSFVNGVNELGGVVKLGGTLTENTTIEAETFYANFNKSGSTINSSIFPLYGTAGFTGTGSESGQYAIAGILGAMSFNGAYNFTPNAASKHGAISGTTFKQNAGNWVGILPAVFGGVELSESGDVTTTTSIRAYKPEQYSLGTAYSGTVTNAVGLYIDDITSSTINAQFTNKFAIYQPGTSDVSRFFGPVQNAGAAVQFTSDKRVKENIVPFTRGLAELEQIETHKFNFTYKKEKEVTGLIAQELELIIPEAVSKGNFDIPNPKDPNTPLESFTDFRMVDQSVLFFTMWNSIKELSAKVKELEAKVNK